MTDSDLRFHEPVSTLSEEAFVARFGGVYEHSPWVAQETFARGLGPAHDSVDGLAAALAETVRGADQARQLALVRAHPDLAGKAAQRGELTAESTSEQAGAGIDQCTPDEFERFQRYNADYKARFGFPFVMAVKGSNRHLILAAFEQRLHNDAETELHRALDEIDRIARFRLEAMAEQR